MGNDRNDNREGGTAIAKRGGLLELAAKLGLPTSPLTDPDAATQVLSAVIERGVNLLAPNSVIAEIPAGYSVAIRAVTFPTDGEWKDGKSNGIWYKTENGVALHRSSIDQLIALCGVEILDSTVKQEPRYVWTATIKGRIRDISGRWRPVIGTKEIDARGDDPNRRLDPGVGLKWEQLTAQHKTDKALAKLREHGLSHAETKARNRLLRAAIGLRPSYSMAEASRPFVYPGLVWSPDRNDPEVQRMIAATELGVVEQVYGPRAAPQAPLLETRATAPDVYEADLEADDDSDEEPEPVERAKPVEEKRAQGNGGKLSPHPDDDPRFNGDGDRQQELPTTTAKKVAPGEPGFVGDVCEVCEKDVDEVVASFSRRNHGGVRCIDHTPRRQASGGSK